MNSGTSRPLKTDIFEEGDLLDTERTEKLREKFRLGLRVTLVKMEGEPEMERGTEGIVRSVDDSGQIHVDWENGCRLALDPERDIFELHDDRLKVILVEPGEEAKVVEIEDSLPEMQKLVDGYIEEYMPFEDEVAIVCNEEGKMRRLPLNRGITDDEGKLRDVIAGTFFICFAPAESDTFLSLPDDLEKKYLSMFRYPEHFINRGGRMTVIRYRSDAADERER